MPVEKLPVEIIRSTTIVEKRREQNDHKHAFIDAQVCMRAHETEIEIRGHRKRTLSRFFFQICEWSRACDGPVDWSIFADTNDAYGDVVAVARDGALSDTACFPVCIYPAAEKFVRVE